MGAVLPDHSIFRVYNSGHLAHINCRATTSNPFFKDYFIIKFDESERKLTFKRCGMDYRGKATIAAKHSKNIGSFSIPVYIEQGQYEIDENESTEDEKIVYV